LGASAHPGGHGGIVQESRSTVDLDQAFRCHLDPAPDLTYRNVRPSLLIDRCAQTGLIGRRFVHVLLAAAG
jgi:hypothetical protein